jgi:SAM-dependent methyltransferase
LLAKIKNKRGILKLNLGAGNNPIQGWINTDLIPRDSNILYIDAKKKMPFKNNTFDYICFDDNVNYYYKDDQVKLIFRLFKILKPGGFLVIKNTINTHNFIEDDHAEILFLSKKSKFKSCPQPVFISILSIYILSFFIFILNLSSNKLL